MTIDNKMPKKSDICLSVRFLEEDHPAVFGNLTLRPFSSGMDIIKQVRPTRLEWTYVRNLEFLNQFKEHVPVVVPTLNTVDGHARSFDGDPIVAPWMKFYGSPDTRFLYICQNNPDDLQAKIDIAKYYIREGYTNFHFDDWYCNAQMFIFKNPCFCEHCMREFSRYLGIPLDYRDYLKSRGFHDLEQLLAAVKFDHVPLWRDYINFQHESVTRFFRRLKYNLDQAYPAGTTMSVNGSVNSASERIASIKNSIDYFDGETKSIKPESLLEVAKASRMEGKMQVVLICPDEHEDHDRNTEAWKNEVRQAIALCYCLGMLPLFPYDVYMRSDKQGKPKPRWYGTWEEYGQPFEIVRQHPDWFDDYEFENMNLAADGTVTIVSNNSANGSALKHQIKPDGTWCTN
ncbi:MAG: hypothetical protein JXR78_04620 [Victivallales bacterium]|nr:hypothetical protein [Victivallales bacterium]